MAEIATAYVQIEPTAKGISGSLSSMFGGEGASAGASFNSGFGRALGGLGKAAIGGIAAVGTAVAAIGTKFVDTAGDVSEYGDNIDKMSQKMGISAQAYQEWDAVLQHSGTSMDSMSRGMQTLQKNAANSADKFEALGLTQEQVASMSTEELFAATITGLQNMGKGAERTALASELLGASSKELGALLNTSAEDTQAMIDRVHELGGVMSDDAVKAAAAYQDQLQDMQTAFQGLSRNLMSEFLPSLTEVMGGLTEIFSGNTEGGLAQISEGINTLANGIMEAMPQLVETASTIIMTLAQAIIDNLPTLIPVAVDLIMQFTEFLIQNLPLLIEAAAQLILQLALGIAEALPELIPAIVDVVLTIAQYLIENIDLLIDAAIQLITGLAMGLIQALPILIEKIPEIVVALVQALIENAPLLVQAVIDTCKMLIEAFVTNFGPIVQRAGEVLKRMLDTVKQWLSQLPERLAYYAGQALGRFVNTLSQLPSKAQQIWNNVIQNVKAFGQNLVQNGLTMAKDFADRLINGLKEIPSKMLNVGKDIVEGLKNGIKEAWNSLTGWVKDLADNLIKGFKDSLKIGSPSKVFRDEVGIWIPAGIAEGIEAGMGTINSAMEDMTMSVMPAAMTDLATASYTPAPAQTTSNNQVYSLLAQYLPIIASGENVNVTLDVDGQRLFRIVQQQQQRNTQLVGVNA